MCWISTRNSVVTELLVEFSSIFQLGQLGERPYLIKWFNNWPWSLHFYDSNPTIHRIVVPTHALSNPNWSLVV